MANQFYRGLQADYSDVVDTIEGASYVSWATTVARSGRPAHAIVEFDGQTHIEIFGGAAVSVQIVTEEGIVRRAWLPVLNAKNQPIPITFINVRDVSDSVKRCLAKAIAMGLGHTLSYYAKGLHSAQFLDEVGVYPDDDLSTVAPKVMQKLDKGGRLKASYLGWPEAIAAASITDPGFRWEVLFYEVPHPDTGEVVSKPYRLGPNGGFVVSVKVCYKGREHVEHLPILGIDTVQTKNGPKSMEHRPNLSPTVADWNASVMRCLAKAIAISTGYGLSIYAGEDIERLTAGGVFLASSQPATAQEPAKIDRQEGPTNQATGQLIASIASLIKETRTDEEALLAHFGHSGGIETMDGALLIRVQEALVAKKKRAAARSAQAA